MLRIKPAWRLLGLCLIVACCRTAYADNATLRIGVKAKFKRSGMLIDEVHEGGPATRIRNMQGTMAALEPGDVVRSINGNLIRSYSDYVTAVNHSLDGVLTIDVVDVNSGQPKSWQVNAIPTGATDYEIARDTYRRAIRTNSIAFPTLNLSVEGSAVLSGLGTVLPNLAPEPPVEAQSDEAMRELIVAVQSIYEHQLEAPTRVFSDDDFSRVDGIIQSHFDRMSRSRDERYKWTQVSAAANEVSNYLNGALVRWAASNGKEVRATTRVYSVRPFRVRTSQSGAVVELLTAADMVLTLLKNRRDPNALDDQSVRLLNESLMWKRLNSSAARAYGNYYYRFVTFSGGLPSTSSFIRERRIEIRSVPDSGEVFFR